MLHIMKISRCAALKVTNPIRERLIYFLRRRLSLSQKKIERFRPCLSLSRKKLERFGPCLKLSRKKIERFHPCFRLSRKKIASFGPCLSLSRKKIVISYYIKNSFILNCIKLIFHIWNRFSHGWSRHTNISTRCKSLFNKTPPV